MNTEIVLTFPDREVHTTESGASRTENMQPPVRDLPSFPLQDIHSSSTKTDTRYLVVHINDVYLLIEKISTIPSYNKQHELSYITRTDPNLAPWIASCMIVYMIG